MRINLLKETNFYRQFFFSHMGEFNLFIFYGMYEFIII